MCLGYILSPERRQLTSDVWLRRFIRAISHHVTRACRCELWLLLCLRLWKNGLIRGHLSRLLKLGK
jgi:hypothetical protein